MTAIEYVQLHCNGCGMPFPPPDQPPATCSVAELRQRAASAVWEVPARPGTAAQTQHRRSLAGEDVCPHCQKSRIDAALAELESPEVRAKAAEDDERIETIDQAHADEQFRVGLVLRWLARFRERRASRADEDFTPVPTIPPSPVPFPDANNDTTARLDPVRDGVPA